MAEGALPVFQDDELIVLNADDHRLKKLFVPIMLKELRTDSLQASVNTSNKEMFASFSCQFICGHQSFLYRK